MQSTFFHLKMFQSTWKANTFFGRKKWAHSRIKFRTHSQKASTFSQTKSELILWKNQGTFSQRLQVYSEHILFLNKVMRAFGMQFAVSHEGLNNKQPAAKSGQRSKCTRNLQAWSFSKHFRNFSQCTLKHRAVKEKKQSIGKFLETNVVVLFQQAVKQFQKKNSGNEQFLFIREQRKFVQAFV